MVSSCSLVFSKVRGCLAGGAYLLVSALQEGWLQKEWGTYVLTKLFSLPLPLLSIKPRDFVLFLLQLSVHFPSCTEVSKKVLEAVHICIFVLNVTYRGPAEGIVLWVHWRLCLYHWPYQRLILFLFLSATHVYPWKGSFFRGWNPWDSAHGKVNNRFIWQFFEADN